VTELIPYLNALARHDGSDLYLTTGAPPCAKFNGKMKILRDEPLKPGEVGELAKTLMDEEQSKLFAHDLELNVALSLAGIGRFRVNIFHQRNQISMVVRNVKMDIPSFASLNLPTILQDVVLAKRGLLLFVGATGSGKSSSLAALIDHRNETCMGHIVTIEDPVEFVHKHKKSVISQREVGVDTRSYHDALKNTLRQAPDVILVGEIRDQETMEHVLNYAETGHLVISTLNANNTNQGIDRIVNFFPDSRRNQVLQDLSNNLVCIASQRLIPTTKGGRIPAVEVLLGTPRSKELIADGKVIELRQAMEKSNTAGMQTFDQSLFELVRSGKVDMEVAIHHADSADNLRMKLKLNQGAVNKIESLSAGVSGTRTH
jgi:twitching motility protein PilU